MTEKVFLCGWFHSQLQYINKAVYTCWSDVATIYSFPSDCCNLPLSLRFWTCTWYAWALNEPRVIFLIILQTPDFDFLVITPEISGFLAWSAIIWKPYGPFSFRILIFILLHHSQNTLNQLLILQYLSTNLQVHIQQQKHSTTTGSIVTPYQDHSGASWL